MKISLIFLLFCSYSIADNSNLWLIDEVLPPQAYSLVKSENFDLQQMKKVGCTCSYKDGSCVVNNVEIKNRNFELKCEEIHKDSIKSIRFINSDVNFLPSDLKKFQNLEKIEVENSKLLEVSQNDLKELKNLKSLQIPRNKIEKIDENLFEFNKKIEKLNFAQNEIKFIHPLAFDDLSHLDELQLLDNDCMSCSGFEKNFINFVKEISIKNCATENQEKSKGLLITSIVIGILIILSVFTLLIVFGARKWKMSQKVNSILADPTYNNNNERVSSDWNKYNEQYGKINYGADLRDSLEKPGEFEKKSELQFSFF
jgi:hypothetical protein